jgi:hypothetical protein
MEMSKILLIVEGQKTERELFKHFYRLYNQPNVEIVAYRTNIYSFYNRLKRDFAEQDGKIDYDLIDLPLFLNDYLKLGEEKKLNEMDFIEKILVFDFDPQDPNYSPQVLVELMENFSNSTENGKLYINYPMVESFRDIESLDDKAFLNSMVSLKVLQQKVRRMNQYKRDVDARTCIRDIEDIDVEIGSKLMNLHYQKVNTIIENKSEGKYLHLCRTQCDKLQAESLIWIVNTSILHLLDEYGILT